MPLLADHWFDLMVAPLAWVGGHSLFVLSRGHWRDASWRMGQRLNRVRSMR